MRRGHERLALVQRSLAENQKSDYARLMSDPARTHGPDRSRPMWRLDAGKKSRKKNSGLYAE
jgi:hypothetical protein